MVSSKVDQKANFDLPLHYRVLAHAAEQWGRPPGTSCRLFLCVFVFAVITCSGCL